MVEDSSFSNKINYVLGDFKSQRASISLHWFKSYGHVGEQGGFHLVVELHREGSVPVACAGLFSNALHQASTLNLNLCKKKGIYLGVFKKISHTGDTESLDRCG